MCNAATGSRSSACARTQTNSEHSSMLLIKLCNCRFIVVEKYVLNFEHEFIREYWRRIVIGLLLLAVLHISRFIVFSYSTAVDSKDYHCPDCPKKWSWCSGKCNHQLFHCLAWDIYLPQQSCQSSLQLLGMLVATPWLNSSDTPIYGCLK